MGNWESNMEVPSQAAESIRVFDQGRSKFYQWLGRKVEQETSLLPCLGDAERLLQATSELFAEASYAITETYQDEQVRASTLISDIWFRDSRDRLRLMTKWLPSVVNLEEVKYTHIEQRVTEVLAHSNSLDVVYAELGDSYFEPLRSDTVGLLSTRHNMWEERVNQEVQKLPLGAPGSTYVWPTADSLSRFTIENEEMLLRGMLERWDV